MINSWYWEALTQNTCVFKRACVDGISLQEERVRFALACSVSVPVSFTTESTSLFCCLLVLRKIAERTMIERAAGVSWRGRISIESVKVSRIGDEHSYLRFDAADLCTPHSLALPEVYRMMLSKQGVLMLLYPLWIFLGSVFIPSLTTHCRVHNYSPRVKEAYSDFL